MILAQNIVAWSNVAKRVDQRQAEQDLIISRAPVYNFSINLLREAQRFRGGTTLNKRRYRACPFLTGFSGIAWD